MNLQPADATRDTDTLTRAGCLLILAVAFLGWGFAGVHMSLNGIVMRVATSDMLADEFHQMAIGEDSDPAAATAERIAAHDLDDDGRLDAGERAKAREGILGQWFGWFTVAFLLGAATGGYLFGYVGDRFGRARAMAASILCYSVFSGFSYFVQTPTQLLVLRFLTCLGIGGMWPNGISLLSEAWGKVSRPILSGIMGTAANVGILAFALVTVLGREVTLTPVVDWRWTFAVGASPILLGLLAIFFVPESPRWLALRREAQAAREAQQRESVVSTLPRTASLAEIFRPPILKTTVIGILLGTIPLFGGWGVSNWATAWASEVGDRAQTTQSQPEPETADDDTESDVTQAEPPAAAAQGAPDPVLKSMTVVARSLPGSISSLLGGALAFWLGRKRTYFLLCIGALICTQGLFRVENPVDSQVLFTLELFQRQLEVTEFLAWTFGLGFFSGFFFGWLPLCLPEMFPTRVRSTGAGVSFNWGRILTAVGILLSAIALKDLFRGEYAKVGQITGFIYACGLIVIVLAPEMTGKELED